LVNLNESVKSLGSRFDVYQRTVDDRLVKMNAEIVLLKNKVELVEANNKSQSLNQFPTQAGNYYPQRPQLIP
jgi:hypothetical protein